jgi:hypothetical protein
MNKWTKAQKLQFAAFVVAASRYTALGGMLIGYDLMKMHWAFVAFEVVSWSAFAILEGFALPFISKGMGQIEAKSFQWWTLLAYRVILLLALPLLGAPLYAAIATGESIISLLGWLYWGWAFLAAGLVAVIADAVGIVESVMPEAKAEEQSETSQLLERIANGDMLPDELAQVGGVDTATADRVLVRMHAGSNGNGK